MVFDVIKSNKQSFEKENIFNVGYNNFKVIDIAEKVKNVIGDDVTIEDDLSRRDFTINAMAQDESGQIIDPFGGQKIY